MTYADELKKTLAGRLFLESHTAWEEVNNPDGINSGVAIERWNLRIEALINLVESQKKPLDEQV